MGKSSKQFILTIKNWQKKSIKWEKYFWLETSRITVVVRRWWWRRRRRKKNESSQISLVFACHTEPMILCVCLCNINIWMYMNISGYIWMHMDVFGWYSLICNSVYWWASSGRCPSMVWTISVLLFMIIVGNVKQNVHSVCVCNKFWNATKRIWKKIPKRIKIGI